MDRSEFSRFEEANRVSGRRHAGSLDEQIGTRVKGSSDKWEALRCRLRSAEREHVDRANCTLVAGDARLVLPELPSGSVECIITSPPYGHLKDYGSPDQIGFGQDRCGEYLPDLGQILSELHRIAKPGAALWIVLDTMRQADAAVALPWEVAVRARDAGWTLHDLVVWDKGRSLPWTHHGRFRGVCEYVLLLGKGRLTHFDVDAVREAHDLSPYWIRFPERYHPDGKAPSDLWHFPIPLQGSWSKRRSHHFCPFPLGLVARMISLTSIPGDVVLDPFSGTGTVLAVSEHLGRYSIGIEVNSSYVNEFCESGFATLTAQAQRELAVNGSGSGSLSDLIIRLRMLKYPRSLYGELARPDRMGRAARDSIAALMVSSAALSGEEGTARRARMLGTLELEVLLQEGANADVLNGYAGKLTRVAPLSKFGLDVALRVVPFPQWNCGSLGSSVGDESWYVYRSGRFYRYDREVTASQLTATLKAEAEHAGRRFPCIVSKMGLSLDRPVGD